MELTWIDKAYDELNHDLDSGLITYTEFKLETYNLAIAELSHEIKESGDIDG